MKPLRIGHRLYDPDTTPSGIVLGDFTADDGPEHGTLGIEGQTLLFRIDGHEYSVGCGDICDVVIAEHRSHHGPGGGPRNPLP
jgi:hypothetical protein